MTFKKISWFFKTNRYLWYIHFVLLIFNELTSALGWVVLTKVLNGKLQLSFFSSFNKTLKVLVFILFTYIWVLFEGIICLWVSIVKGTKYLPSDWSRRLRYWLYVISILTLHSLTKTKKKKRKKYLISTAQKK